MDVYAAGAAPRQLLSPRVELTPRYGTHAPDAPSLMASRMLVAAGLRG